MSKTEKKEGLHLSLAMVGLEIILYNIFLIGFPAVRTRILYKADEVVNIPLTIINNSNLIDPNVRISLYKKYDFSAYNQLYEKIDLNEYSTDVFTLAEDFAYYVDSNEFI